MPVRWPGKFCSNSLKFYNGNFIFPNSVLYLPRFCKQERFSNTKGGIAQLARALAWHARGPRFDSEYLH